MRPARILFSAAAAATGPTDKDGLRAEQADLASKMAAFLAQRWPLVKAEPRDAAAGLPIEAAATGPTDTDGLRAEQADLASKMAAFVAQHWPPVKAEPHDTVYEASVASDDQYPYRGYDQYADRDYQ